MDPVAYTTPPRDMEDEGEHRRLIAQAVELLFQGRLNNVLNVTLTASAASTTVTDARISAFSAPILTPLTANAAAEIGNGTMYVSDTGRVNGTLTIVHANNAQTDRDFKLILVG